MSYTHKNKNGVLQFNKHKVPIWQFHLKLEGEHKARRKQVNALKSAVKNIYQRWETQRHPLKPKSSFLFLLTFLSA